MAVRLRCRFSDNGSRRKLNNFAVSEAPPVAKLSPPEASACQMPVLVDDPGSASSQRFARARRALEFAVEWWRRNQREGDSERALHSWEVASRSLSRLVSLVELSALSTLRWRQVARA